MPKYTVQLGSRLKITDSELPITHCLAGSRRDDFEKPSDELIARSMRVGRVKDPLTPEERDLIFTYNFNRTHGKHDLLVLAWADGPEAATELKAKFPEPQWDQKSFIILPVRTITHG